VSIFFFSVGFEIDLPMLASRRILSVAAIVLGLMISKMAIITGLCKYYAHLDLAPSQQIGCLLSQGGEFAFVAFRLARSYGIFNAELTKLLLTSVALTMALTPFVESIGSGIAEKMMLNTSQHEQTPPPPPLVESIETEAAHDKKEN
jgi:monovalent cation:H+ antiporter-2, CPA2 family